MRISLKAPYIEIRKSPVFNYKYVYYLNFFQSKVNLKKCAALIPHLKFLLVLVTKFLSFVHLFIARGMLASYFIAGNNLGDEFKVNDHAACE